MILLEAYLAVDNLILELLVNLVRLHGVFTIVDLENHVLNFVYFRVLHAFAKLRLVIANSVGRIAV